MLTEFICPDAERIATATCASGVCRMTQECLPVPIRKEMARVRPWEGKPHVTHITSPMRYTVLQLTKDYAESPEQMIFKTESSQKHSILQPDCIEHLTEEPLENDYFSGRPDSYDGTKLELADYKFLGRFKVKKMLEGGMLDEGYEYVEQLNAYRHLYLEHNFPVNSLALWYFVKDWRGYEEARKKPKDKIPKFGRIEIPILDDEWYDQFKGRAKQLKQYIEMDIIPPRCDDSQIWGGKRCLSWCPVWSYCSYGIQIHQEDRDQKNENKDWEIPPETERSEDSVKEARND